MLTKKSWWSMPSRQLSLLLNTNPRNFLIQNGPWYPEALLLVFLMSASLTSPISTLPGWQPESQSGLFWKEIEERPYFIFSFSEKASPCLESLLVTVCWNHSGLKVQDVLEVSCQPWMLVGWWETGSWDRRTLWRFWQRGRWPDPSSTRQLMETWSKTLNLTLLIQEQGELNIVLLCITLIWLLSYRYKVIPKKFDKSRITNYYDSDNPEEVSFLEERFLEAKFFTKGEHTSILKRFRQKFKKTKSEPFAGQVPVKTS